MRGVSVGRRIKEARKEAGLTQAELAERMGVTQSVVSDWERGELQSWRVNSDRLATALSKPRDHFSASDVSPLLTTGVQVVGEVQAGVFRFAVEIPAAERPIIPVLPPPGYERLQSVAFKVVGPSMDLLYPDGSYVIAISAFDTDVRSGDRVIVYQTQGMLREATIKELRIEEDGRIALWPRSTHPDYQEPIYLEASDQDGPEIPYVVVASYQPEDRPAAALQRWVRKKA